MKNRIILLLSTSLICASLGIAIGYGLNIIRNIKEHDVNARQHFQFMERQQVLIVDSLIGLKNSYYFQDKLFEKIAIHLANKKNKVLMATTAYTVSEEDCAPSNDGVTSIGLMAAKGRVAADYKYFPYGTVLWVNDYGFCLVADCGGKIKGPKRLDLFFPTKSEAMAWGKREAKVARIMQLSEQEINELLVNPNNLPDCKNITLKRLEQ